MKLDLEEEDVEELQEEEEHVTVEFKKPQKCLIRHNSKFRIRWDLYIIVLVLYNCILIPIELAFQGKYERKP